MVFIRGVNSDLTPKRRFYGDGNRFRVSSERPEKLAIALRPHDW